MPCPRPPPLWGGACGRFGWPRPACVGQRVLQRYDMIAAPSQAPRPSKQSHVIRVIVDVCFATVAQSS